MLYIYQASYSHMKNPDITIADIYFCSLTFQLGKLFAGFIGQFYLKTLGFKLVYVGSIIYSFLYYLLQVHGTTLLSLYFAYFLIGITQFFGITNTSIFVQEKYHNKIS